MTHIDLPMMNIDGEQRPAPSPYMPNMFCLIPNTGLAFVTVSKNAVTFLKRVAILHATGEWITTQGTTHATIGGSVSSPYLVHVSQMPQYEAEHGPLRKFAVYRDPVERMESGIRMFVLDKTYQAHMLRMGVYQNPTPEHYLRIMDFELTKRGEYIEEHFRPQAQTYSRSDVDDIIGMGDVRNYLRAHNVSFVDERSNASKASYRIADNAVRAHIEKVYADDYQLDPKA